MQINVNENRVQDVDVADNFIKRFLGLMGKTSIPKCGGLLLKNCGSIHCFFMKIPIDVIYLDKNMKVLYKETVYPWKIGKLIHGARHVIEVKEHDADNIQIGDQISCKEERNT